jgi:hypothetical protein
MAFLNERCPQCGKSISKHARFCNSCGAESSVGWSNCGRCKASVGSDSKFCWKCGFEQDLHVQRAVYGDRWFRSPMDFAVRIELSSPAEVIRHGIQVDEGTLALLFQDGRFVGTVDPGYHSTDSFVSRLFNIKPGVAAYAVLLDTRSAEIDFYVENIRVQGNLGVDVRVRLLFSISDAGRFVATVIRERASFSTADLAALFLQDVADAVQQRLRDSSLENLMVEPRAREILEETIKQQLGPVLAGYGLQMDGVRLARFGGEAVEYMKEKLGDLTRAVREHEVNRELRDAIRVEKADAFRDEREMEECYERINHEYGLKTAGREEERKQFIQLSEHRHRLAEVSHEYELRRAEISGRIEEEALKHRSDLAAVEHELHKRQARFEADIAESKSRAALAGELAVGEATAGATVSGIQTDAAVSAAAKHWALAEKIRQSKALQKMEEDKHELEMQRERRNIFEGASPATLVALVPDQQGERIVKIAELEVRKGLGAEESLAMVAEKSPEIAPAVAEALKAKHSGAVTPKNKEAL